MIKKLFLLFIFCLLTNPLSYCGIIGYDISSTLYSNPAWVPNSDKIAYFELIDYGEAKIVAKETYKLELVLNICSIRNPLPRERITWSIPKEEWSKYQSTEAHLSFSPKADKIVFSIGSDTRHFEKGSIYIAKLENNSKFQKIIQSGINPEWSPDGNMIAYEGIVHKDAKLISPDEGRVLLIDNTRRTTNISIADNTGNAKHIIAGVGEEPKWSSDGNRIIFSAEEMIFITDKAGKSIKQINTPYRAVGEPALSPDMSKLVFCKYRYEEMRYWFDNNLYIADLNTGKIIKEIIKPNGTCRNENYPIFDPVWSPDGEYIAYIYNCSGYDLYVIRKDGTGLKFIFSDGG